MRKTVWLTLCSVILVVSLLVGPAAIAPVQAQSGEILWSEVINISNTPDATSSDPFVLADPAGIVHLFWTEKISETPGDSPDTILYSQWDGRSWSRAVDLFFAPVSDGNLVMLYPQAILDTHGILHLIWVSQPNFPYYTLFYSSVPASQAQHVQAWRPRVALAEDLTGTKNSIHLAYEAPDTIHVMYSSGIKGEKSLEEPGVKYLRSFDGGDTWSDPTSIFHVPSAVYGTSDVRVIYTEPESLFVSWTMWDESGNGQAIYLARSLNGGVDWDPPALLAENREGEYERDWNNLIMLPDQQLMAMWEGGYRAYRHAMFSEDNGLTWSEPLDVFPGLIGENGFVEFVHDSNGTLHLFYSQRIREGTGQPPQPGDERVSGLWHSVWEGGRRWSPPVLSGGINPILNPKIAVVNGNTVVATWFSSVHYDIMVMVGQIRGAPAIAPQPWAEAALVFRNTPQPLAGSTEAPAETPPVEATAAAAPGANPAVAGQPAGWLSNPGIVVFIGILPALLVLPFFLVSSQLRKRR